MKLDEDSKQAFAALTARYIDLVYSAALRQVQDQHVAEDITQAVFIILARKMSSLHHDRPLGPWLLQTTKYVASNARRSQFKRKHHERRASEMAQHIDEHQSPDFSPSSRSEWDELSPLLDEGINRLPGKYRDALVMRYFETMSLQQVGATLGISEAAAAKRVSRAVEKLREFFQRHGVAVSSSSALTGLLSTKLTQSAPSGLMSAVRSSAAGQIGSTGSGVAVLAKGAIIMAAAEKLKIAAVVIVALLLGIGGAVVVVKSSDAKIPQAIVSTPTAPPSSSMDIPFTNATMRVLGMSDDPINSDRWWLPDGSRINGSPPGYSWRPEHTSHIASRRSLHFIVNLTSGDLIYPAVELDLGGGLSTGNIRFSAARKVGGFSLTVDVPTDLPSTDATFRLATGPWLTHAEYDLTTHKLSPQPSEITIKSVTYEDDRTCVALRFQNPPGPKLNWMIALTTADGKREEVSETMTIGTDGDQIWKFRSPLADIKQLFYESRPFEERRLNHISIDPIAQTKPVLASTDAPSTSPAR